MGRRPACFIDRNTAQAFSQSPPCRRAGKQVGPGAACVHEGSLAALLAARRKHPNPVQSKHGSPPSDSRLHPRQARHQARQGRTLAQAEMAALYATTSGTTPRASIRRNTRIDCSHCSRTEGTQGAAQGKGGFDPNPTEAGRQATTQAAGLWRCSACRPPQTGARCSRRCTCCPSGARGPIALAHAPAPPAAGSSSASCSARR